jgi:hypothetical protein
MRQNSKYIKFEPIIIILDLISQANDEGHGDVGFQNILNHSARTVQHINGFINSVREH